MTKGEMGAPTGDTSSNYEKVWTQKCGQKLSMTCGVDFVLFKPLYMKIAFITISVFNFSSCETHN